MKQRYHYVMYDCSAIISDPDYMVMPAIARGIFSHLLYMLYTNKGSIRFDPDNMHLLCNCSQQEFEKHFSKMRHKFRIVRNRLSHKVCSRKLKKIDERTQAKRKAGLKGAEKRWHSQSQANGTAIAKISQDKISKAKVSQDKISKEKRSEVEEKTNNNSSTNTNSLTDSLTNSNSKFSPPAFTNSPRDSEKESSGKINLIKKSLEFSESINKLIPQFSRSDRTAISNIMQWMRDGCYDSRFRPSIFDTALQYAKEAKAGDNPIALFLSLMKSELNYQPPTKKVNGQ
ncbi:hypothetical protein ACFLZ8_01520 [Planctomycetota bacterium]